MDQHLYVTIAALSGLAGVLLTQLMTGLFSYYADKRKYTIEVKSAYRNKKAEVGESYFYVTSETMAVLKKSIAFWKNRNDSRGHQSILFLSSEMKKTDEQLARINSENWKFNLVSLYFNVTLSVDQLLEANQRSHQLYLQVLDSAENVAKGNENDLDRLYSDYHTRIFELCNQYEHIYQLLSHDMNAVKTELLQGFGRKQNI